jgi:hypothetical protein
MAIEQIDAEQLASEGGFVGSPGWIRRQPDQSILVERGRCAEAQATEYLSWLHDFSFGSDGLWMLSSNGGSSS